MKNKLLHLFYSGLFGALARLPFGALYKVSDAMCWVLLHVWHYRRRVVRKNLLRVFPERSDAERRELEVAFYHHLCDIFMESIKSLHISDEELRQRIVVRGTELVDEYARQGYPVFMLLGHYANWEWIPYTYSQFSEPIVCAYLYRPTRDKASNDILLRIRSRYNGVPITQKRAVRTILEMKRAGKPFLVSFASDQHPNSKVMKHWTTFLGQDSMYVTGAEEIGRKVDARYVFCDATKVSRGHYRYTLRPMEPVEGEEFPYTISYLRMMEMMIHRQPELWLWSHNRWNISREEYNARQAATSNPQYASN